MVDYVRSQSIFFLKAPQQFVSNTIKVVSLSQLVTNGVNFPVLTNHGCMTLMLLTNRINIAFMSIFPLLINDISLIDDQLIK